MHFRPKKRLGQHFLVDKNIQNKIINACGFKADDIVLEIGSGRGELTELITNQVKYVYALEVDEGLCQILKNNLHSYSNVEIIHADVLKLNLKSRFRNIQDKIQVFGNIPYYISTPIMERLLKYRDKIGSIFITVQKELARRVTAKPGSKDYGSLSCFVQYYTEPKIFFLIKKTCFFPHPKVDSCLLHLEIRRKYNLNPRNERILFKIIRTAFNQRRKTLRNSLKGEILPQKLEVFFERYNIDPDIRPEDLSLRDFANLTNIKNCKKLLKKD